MSPRKVRLVADMIRGKKAAAASNILEFSTKWAKRPLLKLLNSAIANATHNFNLPKNDLYIKTLKVNQGPMLKRWRARAFGRAAEIQKRMSHVEMILDEMPKKENKDAEEKKVNTKEKSESSKSKAQSSNKVQIKKQTKTKKSKTN